MKAASVQYGLFERVAMRLFFAAVIAIQIPSGLGYDALPAPNGLARLVDLTFLLDESAFRACRYGAYLALALYAAGVGWWLALPYLTTFCIAIGSIFNSHGAISHHLQIVSLVLLAQTGAHYFNLLSARRTAPAERSAGEDRLIRWSQAAIAATYLVSGITKLIATSGSWVLQSPLVALQVVKTNEQDFYDRLDPTRVAAGLAMAEWMIRHPFVVASMMGAGLLLELGAPALLLGRRWAAAFGLALILFHETIHRVMQLHFVYNQYLLWIYAVNVPFWACVALRRTRLWRAGTPHA